MGKTRSFLIPKSLSRVLDDLEKEFGKREINFDMKGSFYDLLVTECTSPMELVTGARKKKFTIFSDAGKLYVLNSKGNTRFLEEKATNEFFELFKKIGSTSPNAYNHITFNASYFLAAIQELIRRGNL
ncbi:hypothetical protein [Dickeya zeae]|jgi:hypothetical protein|uniref:hypothetical protein n=1 Tax=Dickeya zeae TaxID=204042 RepID=UPI00037D1697|nr:hypothetical protein [Dickeya zeae]UJR52963.1 hypothetical protein J417_02155 [Dickeya zeae MS1]